MGKYSTEKGKYWVGAIRDFKQWDEKLGKRGKGKEQLGKGRNKRGQRKEQEGKEVAFSII